MEGWVKIGVQRASVLYPNSCYNEACYIEVQVYVKSKTTVKSTIGELKNDNGEFTEDPLVKQG